MWRFFSCFSDQKQALLRSKPNDFSTWQTMAKQAIQDRQAQLDQKMGGDRLSFHPHYALWLQKSKGLTALHTAINEAREMSAKEFTQLIHDIIKNPETEGLLEGLCSKTAALIQELLDSLAGLSSQPVLLQAQPRQR